MSKVFLDAVRPAPSAAPPTASPAAPYASRSAAAFALQNSLYVDSFKMARQIWDDGFRPTVRPQLHPLHAMSAPYRLALGCSSQYLVGLWRGGTPIGICVEEFFRVQVRPASVLFRATALTCVPVGP